MGASQLAKAVYQEMKCRLTLRIREQARSHMGGVQVQVVVRRLSSNVSPKPITDSIAALKNIHP